MHLFRLPTTPQLRLSLLPSSISITKSIYQYSLTPIISVSPTKSSFTSSKSMTSSQSITSSITTLLQQNTKNKQQSSKSPNGIQNSSWHRIHTLCFSNSIHLNNYSHEFYFTDSIDDISESRTPTISSSSSSRSPSISKSQGATSTPSSHLNHHHHHLLSPFPVLPQNLNPVPRSISVSGSISRSISASKSISSSISVSPSNSKSSSSSSISIIWLSATSSRSR